jgi:LSD1 subclass zinc finger protein
MPCPTCRTPLPLDSDAQRVYCDQACRSRAYRARERLRRTAIDLALAQTRAIISGNALALAKVIADADRLLPAV